MLKRSILIIIVLFLSLLYALPNLIFPKQYSIILEGNGAVQYKIEKEGYKNKEIKNIDGKTLILLGSEEEQESEFKNFNDENYNGLTVKKSLYDNTPSFFKTIGATSLPLGLDLQGGVHFLMEVDIDTLKNETLKKYSQYFKKSEITSDGIDLYTYEEEPELYNEVFNWEKKDGYYKGLFKDSYIKELTDFAVEQNIQILRNRVNELGVSEPVIQKEGSDRIVVQLPGIQDITKAKDIIGSTATLEFRIVNSEGDINNLSSNEESYPLRNSGTEIVVYKDPVIKGENIVDASSGFDSQSNLPVVIVNLNNEAGKKMANITSNYMNEQMAELYIETIYNTVENNGIIEKEKVVKKEIIHSARIAGVFSNRFQISGLESPKEAQKLAILLKSGALVAPVNIIEERTIGPLLGKQNIKQGVNSIIVGFIFVLFIMLIKYKKMGLIANTALMFNIIMIFAFLSLFQATLTLPGFAGILLTVGMSVDANVIIFERIKEELNNGKTIKIAIKEGYGKAFNTILDSNITTLLAAIVLFGFGTGAIKGFAVTLSIGIICSMFTAVIVSRFLTELFYNNSNAKKIF